MTEGNDELFEDVLVFPDAGSQKGYNSLIGLDEIKIRLLKESRILLRPRELEKWSMDHYRLVVPLTSVFNARLPMFVFAGDVGTGKTALAETFGDAIARDLSIQVTLYRLSLTARGSGAVGQMTALISAAFSEVEGQARKIVLQDGNPSAAVVLVIDEADAIAQSRELSQMHHEDRAGVNALIRGVDKFGGGTLPVLVVMCTNRLTALDPAVLRRAADTFEFRRPIREQRKALLDVHLAGLGFTEGQIQDLADATGEHAGRDYGCTYSDLVQRLFPIFLLDAFPDSPVGFEKALELAQNLRPTAPFDSDAN